MGKGRAGFAIFVSGGVIIRDKEATSMRIAAACQAGGKRFGGLSVIRWCGRR